MHTTTHRVLVVVDHAVFAESLQVTLTAVGHEASTLVVPAEGRSLGWLRSRVLRVGPDTVVLDLDLARWGDSSALVESLTRAGLDVVVLTADDDPRRAAECLRRGAVRVLSKTRPLADLLTTLAAVRRGEQATPEEELTRLAEAGGHADSPFDEQRRRLLGLSPREREVLASLMEGHGVHEIAASSVVATATVRTQVKSILAKLEVSSQLAAVALADRAGWRAGGLGAAPVASGVEALLGGLEAVGDE